jgi:hypothetical protein
MFFKSVKSVIMLGQKWTQKLDIFSANYIGSLLLTYFSGRQQRSLGVNRPSSGGNVYFANRQTDRILVRAL